MLDLTEYLKREHKVFDILQFLRRKFEENRASVSIGTLVLLSAREKSDIEAELNGLIKEGWVRRVPGGMYQAVGKIVWGIE